MISEPPGLQSLGISSLQLFIQQCFLRPGLVLGPSPRVRCVAGAPGGWGGRADSESWFAVGGGVTVG